MCLVRHISNNSTQEAMEESHVQSFGRACMETLSCRNKACSCYSPPVYSYSKCHALLYKLLYRHTKLQHPLTLRILYYCTFSSLNLLKTTAFVYSEKRETEGLKNSIKMTLPRIIRFCGSYVIAEHRQQGHQERLYIPRAREAFLSSHVLVHKAVRHT